MTTTKNPDYTASAVNLTNATQVSVLLESLATDMKGLADIQGEIEAGIPQHLKDLREAWAKLVAKDTEELKATVETYGSYQDIIVGRYAVKQARVSEIFQVEPLKMKYPKLAPMLIEEVINEKALAALIKGGLLGKATLQEDGVIVPGEVKYAWIIKP